MFRCTCVQLDGRRCHEKKGWKDEEEEVIPDRIGWAWEVKRTRDG